MSPPRVATRVAGSAFQFARVSRLIHHRRCTASAAALSCRSCSLVSVQFSCFVCGLTRRSTGPSWAGLRPRHVGRLARTLGAMKFAVPFPGESPVTIVVFVDVELVILISVALFALVLALIPYFRAWRAKLYLLSGTCVVIGIAVSDTTDSAYYPRVLEAVNRASPREQAQILSSWAEYSGPNEGFITILGLHHVLWESGYCTNLIHYLGCKPLPTGTEAMGIAKDELHSLCGPYRKPFPTAMAPNLSLNADVPRAGLRPRGGPPVS